MKWEAVMNAGDEMGAVLLAVAGIGLVLAVAFTAWRRSVAAEVAAIRRRMRRLDPAKVPEYLDRKLAELAPGRSKAVVERLVARLGAGGGEVLPEMAESLRLAGRVFDLLSSSGPHDPHARQAVVDGLENRAAVLTAMVKEVEEGDEVYLRAVEAQTIAAQDRLFAALLRAQSLGHLAALYPEFDDFRRRAERLRPSFFVNLEFLRDLEDVLENLDQLGRLSLAEDRALFLGQALTRTLKMQERLVQRTAVRPSGVLVMGGLVLESLRQLLAGAVQDIRQQAELVARLRSKVLVAQRQAVLVLEVENVGQGHARNVEVDLETGDPCLRVVEPHRVAKSLLRHQSVRLEFQVEPGGCELVSVEFRISYEDLEHRRQHLELHETVELRRVSTPRRFCPLSPNPYVVGRPLGETDVFIGREKTFDRIESNLRGAHQDNVVVLIGQWRMGKTSILRRLPAHLGEAYVPVLVDLQGMIGSGEEEFFRSLVADLHDQLGEAGFRVSEPDAEDFALDPSAVFRRRFLREALQVLGERRLLIMFDEFEVIEQLIESGRLRARVLPYLRSLVQHEQNVSFMFAGTHRLDELTGDYWSVLFNLAVYLDIGHMHEGDVEKLLTEPTAGVFDVDPLALEKAYQLTGGHPHFSQLLAWELVEHRNRQRLSYVTVQDVNVVADTVADKAQIHITRLWNGLSASEQYLLLALTSLLEREGMATTRAAYRCLDDLGIEPGDLPAAARRLERQEILVDHAGQWSFRMDLLRRWLERNHSLESEAALLREHVGQGDPRC